MLADLFANQMVQDICRAVFILVVGIFAMRIIRRLLKTSLEKNPAGKGGP